MKFIELHINGFGRWRSRSFSFAPGFNLLYGPNEAGKSTLLQCLCALFYGLGDSRSRSLLERPRERYRPWDEGSYGASLRFELGGRRYKLERAFGRSRAQDRLALLDDLSGEALPLRARSEPGEMLLGMSLGEFRNSLFVGQLAARMSPEDELKRRLLSLIAGGEAERSLEQMLESLAEQKRRLASERAGGALLRGLMQEQETLLRELDAALEQSAHIAALREAGRRAAARLSAQTEQAEKLRAQDACLRLRAENRRLNAGIAAAEALRQARGRAEAEARADAELLSYFSAARRARVEALLEEGRRLEGARAEQRRLYEAAEMKRLELERGGRSRAEAESLAELSARREALEARAAARKRAREQEEARFTERLQAEERALAARRLELVRLQAARGERLAERERRASLREGLARLDARAAALEQRRMSAQESRARLAEERTGLEAEEAAQRRQLEAAERRADELARWEEDWRGLERGRALLRILGPALLLSGAVGLAGLFLSSAPWPWFVLAAALLGLLALGLRWAALMRSGRELQRQRAAEEAARGELEKARQLLEQYRRQLLWLETRGRDGEEEARALEQEGLALAQEHGALRLRLDELGPAAETEPASDETEAGLAERAAALDREAQRLAELHYTPSAELELEEAGLALARRAWAEACRAEGLEDEAALAAALERAQGRMALIAQEQAKQEALQLELEAGAAAEQRLLAALREEAGDFLLFNSLVTAEQAFSEVIIKTKRHDERMNTLRAMEEKAALALEGRSHEAALMRLEENRRWLKDEQAKLSQRGERLLPPPEERTDLKARLLALEAALQESREVYYRGEEQLRQAQSGAASPVELERLLALNRAAEAEVREELAAVEQAERWVSEAEQRLRQSFGPAINERFEANFALLTGTQPGKLRVDQDFTLRIEDEESRRAHEQDYFSAGKVDQLYLALRLAVIDSVYARDEALPLIFDDSFVQFDAARTRAALAHLMRLAGAGGRQILFASCHASLLALLRSEHPGAFSLVELGAAGR